MIADPMISNNKVFKNKNRYRYHVKTSHFQWQRVLLKHFIVNNV